MVKKSIMTTLYLYVGVLVSFGISLAAAIPVRMILGEDKTKEPLIIGLIALPIGLGVCFFMFFRRGYEERREELKSWYIPLAVGTAVHFALCMILHFVIYIAGPFVEQISFYIYKAQGGRGGSYADIPYSLLIPFWLLHFALMIAAAICGVICGKRYRNRESKKFFEEEEKKEGKRE